jgi:hypothetical protein
LNATIGKELKKNNDQMKTTNLAILLICILTLTSCATLTDAQLTHRNEIEREIGKVYNEYVFKTDSLLIEYNRK